jgi:hypothetical protein
MKRKQQPEIVMAYWPAKSSACARIGASDYGNDSISCDSFWIELRAADPDRMTFSREDMHRQTGIWVWIDHDGRFSISVQAHGITSAKANQLAAHLKFLRMLERRIGILNDATLGAGDGFFDRISEVFRRLKITRAVCYRPHVDNALVGLEQTFEVGEEICSPLNDLITEYKRRVERAERNEVIAVARRARNISEAA